MGGGPFCRPRNNKNDLMTLAPTPSCNPTPQPETPSQTLAEVRHPLFTAGELSVVRHVKVSINSIFRSLLPDSLKLCHAPCLPSTHS